MKFGTQADPATGGKPADGSESTKDDRVHEQNTAELNRINQSNESGDGAGKQQQTDTGTKAPTVDSNGNALPGTDGNTAVDDSAKREQKEDEANLDKRIDESKDLVPASGQTYTTHVKSDPSARTLGLDVDTETNEVERILAESAAATGGHGSADGVVIFSSHPIQKLQVGAYQFEDTVLKLNESQVSEFEELLEKLPMSERLNIKKLDVGKVDQIVSDRMSSATKQFDSSAGREALAALQRANPKLGTVPIDGPTAHANVSQTDNNMEIPLKTAE